MFGNLGNLGEMAKMMSKAKDIQSGLKKFKEELPTMEFSAASPDGMVKVTVTGDFQIREISIDESAMENRAGLQEQIPLAVNAAIAAAKTAAQEKMNEITGGLGLDLPGIF